MSYAVSNHISPRARRRPYVHPSLVGGHAANIRETEDAYFIDLIAPGRTKELFSISVKDQVLVLGIKVNDQEPEGQFIQREFSLSESEKRFRLPSIVDADAISATYENGILTVKLPKKEEAQPRTIEIQ